MPNDVRNHLIFDKKHLGKVSAITQKDGALDFSILIPMPDTVYLGNLSKEDEDDFQDHWYNWRAKNWGTKWNAYNSTRLLEDDKVILEFDTAWTIPYPIVIFIANRIMEPFTHKYFDESDSFWGLEEWGIERGRMVRLSKRYCKEDDREPLRADLYKPYEVE